MKAKQTKAITIPPDHPLAFAFQQTAAALDALQGAHDKKAELLPQFLEKMQETEQKLSETEGQFIALIQAIHAEYGASPDTPVGLTRDKKGKPVVAGQGKEQPKEQRTEPEKVTPGPAVAEHAKAGMSATDAANVVSAWRTRKEIEENQ